MPENADALLELSLVEERLVGIPVDLGNVRVFDRGYAFTVQHLLDIEDALAHLLGSSRGNEPRDGVHGRVFFEDPGGVAAGVPVDGAGGGVGRGPSDVRQLEGKRIGDSIMAGGMHAPA